MLHLSRNCVCHKLVTKQAKNLVLIGAFRQMSFLWIPPQKE